MDNQEFSVEVFHHNLDDDPDSIAGSLRHSSKKHRHEILTSHGYHALWLGEISRERYAELLVSHYFIRKSLETVFQELGDNFVVTNQFFDDEKVFSAKPYAVVTEVKSTDLLNDFVALTDGDIEAQTIAHKAQSFIDYIHKIKNQYCVALLGVAYTLEETQCYAGPRIGAALNKKLDLKGGATSYLMGRSDDKQALWRFRQSLNTITDFQTQANIVIASTLSYRMYRDLLDPYAVAVPASDNRFHA